MNYSSSCWELKYRTSVRIWRCVDCTDDGSGLGSSWCTRTRLSEKRTKVCECVFFFTTLAQAPLSLSSIGLHTVPRPSPTVMRLMATVSRNHEVATELLHAPTQPLTHSVCGGDGSLLVCVAAIWGSRWSACANVWNDFYIIIFRVVLRSVSRLA